MNTKNGKAPMGNCSSPSGLSKVVSNEHYTTTTSPVNKAETEALKLLRTSGFESVAETLLRFLKKTWAENEALELLRTSGYEQIQQLDWLAKKDGKYVVFEVKGKELFEPGTNFPHWGIGLGKKQLWLRTQLLNDLDWPTYLINFVPETDKVYGAFLSELETRGGYIQTPPPKSIRIYPLESYEAIHNAPNQNLGGLN